MKKLEDTLKAMWEYQKENKIVNMCVNNTIFLYNLFSDLLEIKCGVVCHVDNDTLISNCHTWLEIGEYIFDGSYDVNSLEKKQYFTQSEYFEKFKHHKEINKDYIIENVGQLERSIKLRQLFPRFSNEYYRKLQDYVAKHVRL